MLRSLPGARGVPERPSPSESTKNLRVAQHLFKTLDPDGSYGDLDWQDVAQVSQAWKALLAKLEQRMRTRWLIAPPAATATQASGRARAGRRAARKTKLAVRIPPALSAQIAQAMARDGYSRNRQSLWLEEALLSLSRHDPDMAQSLVGDRAQGPNRRQMIVVLSEHGRDTLRDLIIRLRLQVPTIEGVQSLVLRCAMRFRIRNPQLFVPWARRRG